MKNCLGCQIEFSGDQPLCFECYHDRLIKCPNCKQTFIYIKEGDKKKGQFWEGYYRCQNKCIDPERYGNGMYKIKDSEAASIHNYKRTAEEKLNLFK